VEVKVTSEAGAELQANRIGEIAVRTGFTQDVYWRRPDLNRERFRDGWFLTRDHGYLDDDGFLHYAGRMDDMIKSGQMYVAPAEVERVILEHAAVREVSVIGLPDARWGEAVTAIVVPSAGGSPSEADIKTHCRSRLAAYQIPKAVYFTDVLPKDPQGKVKTRQLREEYTPSNA
jgi:long-chain acyl-CoA synthetase